MKRVNIFHLIASICWFLWSLIKLLNWFIELPPILSACRILFLITAFVMHIIILSKTIKDKKKNKNSEK